MEEVGREEEDDGGGYSISLNAIDVVLGCCSFQAWHSIFQPSLPGNANRHGDISPPCTNHEAFHSITIHVPTTSCSL